MTNGAAISFVSKMQTSTAPSSTSAESVTLFDCSTDVLGLRDLLSELVGSHAGISYDDIPRQ
jgi:hypothetical protein